MLSSKINPQGQENCRLEDKSLFSFSIVFCICIMRLVGNKVVRNYSVKHRHPCLLQLEGLSNSTNGIYIGTLGSDK